MARIRSRLRLVLLLFCVVLLVGTIGYMLLEGVSFTDALYFSIVTIATVGYGDIHPLTQGGKLFAVLLIISGVGVFLGVIANATELMLTRREQSTHQQQLNMVIGVFFSEVGKELLTVFSSADPGIHFVRGKCIVKGNWDNQTFARVSGELRKHEYEVTIDKINLFDLKSFLAEKRNFLVGLLESPSLLEHDLFTNLLWAVFHVTEELAYREHLDALPTSDLNHIAADIRRAYHYLVYQWLEYMRHLKDHYPYLFSLAMRTNPFDREASPIVT